MSTLKKSERAYYANLLKLIICNPKSVFYEDRLLIKQWLKLQKPPKNKRIKK